jgi:hypothetical protein
MITIWKKIDDVTWEFVEDFAGSSLAARLAELRLDGNEYRAEEVIIGGSEILGV